MQLILSSDALPKGKDTALFRAVRRRDLEGIELVLGAGSDSDLGPTFGGSTEEKALSSRKSDDPPIHWLLLEDAPSARDVLYWSRRAHLHEAGLLLRDSVPESPLGIPVALLHSSDPETVRRATVWAELHDAHTAWEVDLARCDPDRVADVLKLTAAHLAHVRLLGAGPESQASAPGSTGTGTVFKELALRGFDGTVSLVPSARGSPEVWRRWLFDERGWGCNTAAEKKAARDGSPS